ncbi:MAG TPA: hypothetical protein VGD79_11410 [Thermoanaerobaculia bacterium]|jgi:hypothetical protein
MKRIVVVLAFIVAIRASSQEIRVGGLEGTLQSFTSYSLLIDASRPASANGTVNTASVAWTNATTPCDGIFYVRFYAMPSNAMVAVMIAERGPFRAVNGINTVALEPPVSVTTETYIGIRRATGPESCGQPYATYTPVPGRALASEQNFVNGSTATLAPFANFTLQAQASNTASVRASTIVVAGSTAGGFGSLFRTSLTLANPTPVEIRGKLVFRRAGVEGTDADPSLDYLIPAKGTLNYDDVIAAMNQSGLGSLDVYTTASPSPIASARIFNDAGEEGTSGLSEEAIPARRRNYSAANVLIPTNLTDYRLNIGIRTIAETTVQIEVYDAAGNQVGQRVRSYPANYFNQVGVSDFLEGGTVPPGGRIYVYSYDKEFYVYGSVTDNRTNDPSMRLELD